MKMILSALFTVSMLMGIASAEPAPSGGGDDPCISEPLLPGRDRVCATPPPSHSDVTFDIAIVARNEYCEAVPDDPICQSPPNPTVSCGATTCTALVIFGEGTTIRTNCAFAPNGTSTCATIVCPGSGRDCFPILLP